MRRGGSATRIAETHIQDSTSIMLVSDVSLFVRESKIFHHTSDLELFQAAVHV